MPTLNNLLEMSLTTQYDERKKKAFQNTYYKEIGFSFFSFRKHGFIIIHYTNSSWLPHFHTLISQKGFLIVETRFLTITFSYKPNLICLNLSIYSSLSLIDLLALYEFYSFKCLYKILDFVRIYRF